MGAPLITGSNSSTCIVFRVVRLTLPKMIGPRPYNTTYHTLHTKENIRLDFTTPVMCVFVRVLVPLNRPHNTTYAFSLDASKRACHVAASA